MLGHHFFQKSNTRWKNKKKKIVVTLPAAVFFPGALSPGAPDITDKRLLAVPEVPGARQLVVMAGGVEPLSDGTEEGG